MYRPARQLMAFAACIMLAACSVSPAGPCNDDSQCTAPAACDTGRHVCALPCEPKCGVGEVCLSAKCAQQGPVVRSVSAPTTWSRRTGNLTVTASIDSGAKSTTSAALHVAGSADVPGTTNDSGAVRTYSFAVPASVQAAGSEAPIAFTIDAVDDAGTATLPDAVGVGQLLIDDAPPQPGGVTVTGGVTGTDGLQWFKQTATGSIDAQVSVEDHGSGVNASTLRLMAGAVRLDNGAPQCAASGTSPAVLCHFFISPQTALVPAGGQAEVTFTVAGQDVAGNDMAVQQAKVGIDGKAPVITFTIGNAGDASKTTNYPANFTDCNGGAVDPSQFCGHDGSHFLRAGDATHELAFVVSDSSGASDQGSGADPSGGACTIGGASTCTVRFDAPSNSFRIPADFATASFTTAPDGTGTVSVTVNARDAVGNAAAPATIPNVAVTRVKWMRQVAVASLAGAPILSSQLGQVIVAGAVPAGGDPIQAVKIADGSLGWSAGHLLSPAITSVSANMALDTTPSDVAHPTPALMVNSGTRLYALHIATGGIDEYCTGAVTGGSVGAPIIFGGGPTAQIVSVGTHSIFAYSTGDAMAAGGAGCNPEALRSLGTPVSGPPSASGGTIFFGYDNSATVVSDKGIESVGFSASTFGTPVLQSLGKQPSTNAGASPISPGSELFFGIDGDRKVYRYATDLVTQRWASSPALSDNIFTQPLVRAGLVLGSSSSLVAYTAADGKFAWQFPAASVTQVSAPTVGTTAIFISDSANREIVTFDPATRTKLWSYAGSGTTTPPTDLQSVATEAVLGPNGVLYFGDTVGHVYALITDTTPAASAPGDWPRTGFDNCNSNHAGNTGFTCQ